MEIGVVDTETTGIGEGHQVIEIAITDPVTDFYVSQLVCPTREIEIEAMATHHITPAMLEDAPTAAEWAPELEVYDAIAAHNLAFDVQHVLQTWPGLPLPRLQICTWRCAQHVWPDAPGHKNQELRYWLGLAGPSSDLPPHRALPDTQVTGQILTRLLEDHTAEELAKLTETPILLKTIRFGKYRGARWEEMDYGFLRWVLDPKREFGPDVLYTARHWMREKFHTRS